MKPVRVDCDIRSSENKQTFSTTGTVHHNELSFLDPSQDKHILTWNQSLIYKRIGATIMEFHFDPNQKTTGTYQTMGQYIDFDITTTSYRIHDNCIRIEYTLYQDQEPITTTTISIDYEIIKEE